MSNPTPLNNAADTSSKMADTTKQAMAKEISQKWDKFSEADVSAFKTKDELIGKIVSKYGQDKMAVTKDVDGFLHGRTFG
jgi:hypothetical protein